MIERGFCLGWDSNIIISTVLTTGLISVAYFLISLVLYTAAIVTNFKIPLTYRNALLAFATFIFLCGTSRVCDIVLIWASFYWLKVILDLLTGIASIAAFIYIIPLAKRFMNFTKEGK